MNRFLCLLLAVACACPPLDAAESPLRVFIRSGPKSHGPGQHDHPRFLKEWTALLNERGMRATGGETFPTAQQLAETDVLIIHAQEGGNVEAADRANLNAFLARGGGILALHAGAVSRDPDWYKTIVGGSWRFGTTKWLEGPMHLYFVDRDSPILKDVSNWAMDDEIYYDMELMPEAHVLATAYTPKPAGARNDAGQKRADELTAGGKRVSIYDIQPQMWTYERTVAGGTKPYRALVSIPGHFYENFNRPNYRAILLRSIAWVGQRRNIDEFCKPDELGDALRYVAGGPTHPSKAAAKLEVHPEFNVSLVASEPLINKVMNLDWDERGRLWVCETPEYPNGRRAPNVAPWKDSGSLRGAQIEREPQDRISILTDTNGDGIMDHKQVFADKLELVTSFVLYKNGVIAAASPDIWYLEDTNGDGVADRRTKLYTGLGISDTHAVINNLRWGFDGWIYATHGYSRGDVTSPDGSKQFGPDNSGVVRFKPDGSAFEQYSSRNGNTWGLDITWDGQVFWTQPTSGTVFFHTVLPESILAKGKIPGTTSWKGMITNQRTFPAMAWSEQAYVQIDQVGRFTAAAGCAIYEGGAWPEKWNYSYFTTEPTLNIVHHEFVRPDGVSYAVSKEPGREETEFIRSTDLWFRPIETRIGPDGALYVIDFYNQAVIHNDTRGPQHSAANAAVRPDRDHYFSRIWRVQHKEAKKLPVIALARNNLEGLLDAIRTSPNIPTRKIALRLAQENFPNDPRVKGATPTMESVAMATYNAARTAIRPDQFEKILTRFVAAKDDWTKSAFIAAATEHSADYVRATLHSGSAESLSAFVDGLMPALSAANVPAVVEACTSGGPLVLTVLRGLAGLKGDLPTLDGASATALKKLLGAPATAAAALRLAAKWDRDSARVPQAQMAAHTLAAEFARADTPDARRAELASALIAFPATRAAALDQTVALLGDPASSPGLKRALLAGLLEQPPAEVRSTLVALYSKTKSAEVFDQLLTQPESALALIAALKDGKISVGDLGPANLARLRTHPSRRVASAATRVLDTLQPANKEKDELIAKLLPEIIRPGNAANGKMIFAGTCAICHRFGEIGTRDVGPPLTGIGAHGAADLLTAIVDPNRQVEPNYWQWNITTKKGETFVGVVTNENGMSLTLRNQAGDTEVKKDNISSRENTHHSLMPEGFEGLGAAPLRDLISFLVSASTPTPNASNVAASVSERTSATAAAPSAVASNEGPKEGGRGDAPLPPLKPVVWEPGKTKVLIIAGGSSHKFGEFFDTFDVATLRAAGFSVNYTEDRDQAAAELPNADVAVISVNRKFFDTPAYRKAVFDFAAAGKGLVMLHPGVWYGYPQWPELNAQIVGGGARGHDKLGKYSVNAVKPEHPVMRGVPAHFDVEDELYYLNAEPEKIPPGSAPIEVLAQTSPSVKFNQPHPAVWITKHDKARIVGITLGHDERVHGMEAFKTLLTNAVTWASGK